VELKNSEAQLRRGLDQMTAFAEYVNEVWLACTPLMAAEYLHKHTASKTVRRWDPEVLNRKVSEFGSGLLIVADSGGRVIEAVVPSRMNAAKLLGKPMRCLQRWIARIVFTVWRSLYTLCVVVFFCRRPRTPGLSRCIWHAAAAGCCIANQRIGATTDFSLVAVASYPY